MRHPSLVPTLLRAATLLLVIGSAGVPTVRAQVDVWVPELPMTQDYSTSARALGMGGAFLAVSDDVAALHYNPAGLARVTRVEFSASLTDIKRDIKTTAAGQTLRASLARSRVNALGFVYPFPTYRGSMVIALGYDVPWVVDRQYRRQYDFEGTSAVDEVFDEGGIGEWSFGYAVDVSPTLSLGFSTSWIRGTWLRDLRFMQAGQTVSQLVTEYDVQGYTASLGALARAGSRTQLGFTVDLPRWIHWDPTESSVDGVTHYAQEDLTLPFSAAGGLTVTFERLLLAADARYTDWTRIDYQGPMRYQSDSGMRDAYRRTLDLHIGAEYLLDLVAAGLRLRAGYAREPLPYRIMLRDIVLAEDPADDQPVYAPASFDPQRSCFTLGAGVLIAQSMTIDLAYAQGSLGRAVWQVTEEQDERRIVLSAAFRLD